jgi:hypothetical protein
MGHDTIHSDGRRHASPGRSQTIVARDAAVIHAFSQICEAVRLDDYMGRSGLSTGVGWPPARDIPEARRFSLEPKIRTPAGFHTISCFSA